MSIRYIMVESDKKAFKAKMKQKQTKKNIFCKIEKKAENFISSDTVSATATKFLLMFIAIGGVTIVGATLPGLVRAIGVFSRRSQRMKNGYPKEKIAKSLSYLKHEKLIEILEEKNGKMKVRLTNKGKERLVEYSLDNLEIKKPKKWDGKWRVLMFDIPSHPKRYDYARDALRHKIKELGFYQIQKSVWVYPYECEDELLYIAEIYGVQDCIEIMTVEKILHEKLVKEKFSFL